MKSFAITVRRIDCDLTVLQAEAGETLREVLLRSGVTPYRGMFRKFNCKGLGICGSCTVGVKEADELYPRRSCQIRCFQDMEIQLE